MKRLAVTTLLGVVALGALAQETPTAIDGAAVVENPSIALARELTGAPQGEMLSGAELTRVTEEVTALMRCPVCQGLSVADSPTESALAMKSEARELLAAGFTGDQVLAYFERSYGEFIRLSPKPEGFNLVVWILPVVGLLIGALVIGARVRRRRPARGPVPGSEDEPESKEKPEVSEQLAGYLERVRREASE